MTSFRKQSAFADLQDSYVFCLQGEAQHREEAARLTANAAKEIEEADRLSAKAREILGMLTQLSIAVPAWPPEPAPYGLRGFTMPASLDVQLHNVSAPDRINNEGDEIGGGVILVGDPGPAASKE